ncbi:hypothetical protein NQ318_013588 [Aromia moschata]|uniref:Uncharacterized protein n=1 Tax=Aromia moschata TaxID=1265417 RepID=A0AAV8YEC7_9CUCU|nr:hypothetical protein NQ318_013588 [Aromia moschata]
MDSFVCKIVVLECKEQRVLKPRRVDERANLARFSKASSIKKCLFGVASSADTEKMLQEQYDADRQRFSEKFGFDIEEIENMECENNENAINGQPVVSKKRVAEKRVLKAKRRVFKPHNRQAIMTGSFFRVSQRAKRPSVTHQPMQVPARFLARPVQVPNLVSESSLATRRGSKKRILFLETGRSSSEGIMSSDVFSKTLNTGPHNTQLGHKEKVVAMQF